jgi:hypothetical protein
MVHPTRQYPLRAFLDVGPLIDTPMESIFRNSVLETATASSLTMEHSEISTAPHLPLL